MRNITNEGHKVYSSKKKSFPQKYFFHLIYWFHLFCAMVETTWDLSMCENSNITEIWWSYITSGHFVGCFFFSKINYPNKKIRLLNWIEEKLNWANHTRVFGR